MWIIVWYSFFKNIILTQSFSFIHLGWAWLIIKIFFYLERHSCLRQQLSIGLKPDSTISTHNRNYSAFSENSVNIVARGVPSVSTHWNYDVSAGWQPKWCFEDLDPERSCRKKGISNIFMSNIIINIVHFQVTSFYVSRILKYIEYGCA